MKKILLIVIITISIFLCTQAIAEMEIYFLDVGQGDAIVLTCDGQTALIDAGMILAGPVVNRFLKEDLNISELDAVIATHSHDDHIGGMQAALEGLSTKKIYSSPTISMFYWFENVQPVLRQKELEIQIPEQGDSIRIGKADLTFINSDDPLAGINDRSTVVRVDYGSTSFLLVGDAESAEEQRLLDSGVNLKADVLKVGHHGGLGSTSSAFLSAVSPSYAIISVGVNNDHGHPAKETLTLLEANSIDIYRTDRYGTVKCISDGETITIEIMKAMVN